MGQLLRKNSKFRRLFFGRVVTNIGDSLYMIAGMWLVHDMTGSALFTGIAGFLTQIPTALQFLSGPIVDRVSIRLLLVTTQLIQGVAILVIPLAAATGRLTIWLLLTVIPLLGLLNQFVYPAQNAAIPQIVEDDDVTEANSLLSFALRGVDLAATAASGVLIAMVGVITLFWVDSVTFFLATVLFAGVVVPPTKTSTDASPADQNTVEEYVTELKEGFAYIRDSLLKYMVVSSVVANFAIGASFAVLPAFADRLGGSETYGFLFAAISSGTLVGSLLASKLEDYPYGVVQVIAFLLGTILWLTAIYLEQIPLTVALFALGWIPVGVSNVMLQTFRQTAVPEDLIGRVTSASYSISTAATPLGFLVGGAIGDVIGSKLTLMYAGFGFLPIVLMFSVVPALRRLEPLNAIDPTDIRLE